MQAITTDASRALEVPLTEPWQLIALFGWLGGTAMVVRQFMRHRTGQGAEHAAARHRTTGYLLFAQLLGLIVLEPLVPSIVVVPLTLLLLVGAAASFVRAERESRRT